MKIIKLKDYIKGNFLGSRKLGRKIREDILFAHQKGKVEISFKGISLVSQSFADECFGKLTVKIGLTELRNDIEFSDLNKPTEAIINFTIADRDKKGEINNV